MSEGLFSWVKVQILLKVTTCDLYKKCIYRKEDIRFEALKGLKPTAKSAHVTIKEVDSKDEDQVMPMFVEMILYVKEKVR